MSKYAHDLPQLGDRLFLTDGGLETTLVFHDGLDLPYFAAFDLLKDDAGYARLKDYFRTYAAVARDRGLGFVLESCTWRASADWGTRMGWTGTDLERLNRRAIALLHEVRDEFETQASPMVVSGCIGPRGDGYDPGETPDSEESARYHAPQIAALKAAGADMVSAFTIPTVEEAVGIVVAARDAGIPGVVSFTVETDGRLPSGRTLGDAIEAVDAETGGGPVYYMVNCAHPTHFDQAVAAGEAWCDRIRGVRANASRLSHAELDACETLDDGDPEELGAQYRDLRGLLRNLTVLGGCCGTDHRHVEAIGRSCCSGH